VRSKRTKTASFNLFLTGFVYQRGVSTPRNKARIRHHALVQCYPRRKEIMKSRLSTLAFPIASITIVLCWLLFVLFFHNPVSQALFILGVVVVGVGILLIILAMATLRRKGNLQQGGDFTATTVVVTRGVYSVVRHPLYLGWLLTYPAAMLVSQHWLIVILGVLGIVSIDQITRMADEQLLEKFGVEYQTYMQQVPRLNILLGIVRQLRRMD
jgi:protein-S-isoprenylcysteine O-methyltransferase Ste14